MRERIGLDFETYGGTSLPDHGLDRYASCKTFRPLIGSIALKVGPPSAQRYFKRTLDFVSDRRASTEELREALRPRTICAHNAPFEQRVLDELGIPVESSMFIDSAVVARAAGAGGSLEAAAPQLLNMQKLELGKHLIRLFSIPGRYQEENGNREFDPRVIEDHPDEWRQFREYCELDALLSLRIVEDYGNRLTSRELEFQQITMDMNRTGWHVDVDMVEEMQRRYLENQEMGLATFRQAWDAHDLNLASLKQLKEWCAERGVKATSFDEKHVAKMLTAVQKKLTGMDPWDAKYVPYMGVAELLRTKQILGGASLKKLQTILDTQVDGRLRDQYLHCGAGQTLRTTGRSVQMQNLKRLANEIDDVEELKQVDVEWDNEKLAKNIRQMFTATDPAGALIVGDFSSVESRGLGYIAGAKWKSDAFRQGQDMYKVLAAKIFNVHYDDVLKPQRQVGKVGELSCGYGAGGGAVQAFASNMGVELTEAEAAKLVSDWRLVNPEIEELWGLLNSMLLRALELGSLEQIPLPDGLRLTLERSETPGSLVDQHPGAQSIRLAVWNQDGTPFLMRYFHGCYKRGRNVGYYKPSERKTGDLWKNHFTDQKTKQVRFYELYGGKLAGILTQSFCREIFFRCLAQVHHWCERTEGITLVGQFHDEIVVDWAPGGRLTLEQAKAELEVLMSDPGHLASFPLAADIKHDYRYTK